MAGREMDVNLGIASLAATELGVVTIMYTAQLGFEKGFAGATIGVIMALAMYFVGRTGFVIQPLRAAGVMTIPELFEKRFGKGVRWLAGLFVVLGVPLVSQLSRWPGLNSAPCVITPATTASTSSPNTSSMIAAPRMICDSRRWLEPMSLSTRAVMPTLVAVRVAPRNACTYALSPGRSNAPTAHPRECYYNSLFV